MKIITGMHRSGTSLVGSLLLEAGLDLGGKESLRRGDKWNPTGYFEHNDFLWTNIPLIHGPFGKFAYFFPPSTETIMKRAARRADKLRSINERFANHTIKDPRFCLTLPAWQKYGADVEKVLICLRDPIQVARSVNRRNRITINYALKVWLEHNRRLLENIGELPYHFVYYSNLLNPDTFARELRSAVGFLDPELELDESTIARIGEACVKPGLQHHQDKNASYPPEVEELWRQLMEKHESQFHTQAPSP